MKLSSLILAAAVAGSQAFTPLSYRPQRHGSVMMRMSEPSDTSSDALVDDDDVDEILEIESEDVIPTASEAMVTNVLDLMPNTLGEVSESTRATINEVLLKLESMNPTKEPTLSPLLNGVWELRYAAGYSSENTLPSPTRQLALFLYSGGYSPGLFAMNLAQKLPSQLVSVGDLEISISREQPRVEAKVDIKTFGSIESSVIVKARLEVESEVRLRETYESATVMDRNIELPELLQYSRDLYVTYVDEDILVVRDGSGVPELLVRKEKSFTRNWGTEPE